MTQRITIEQYITERVDGQIDYYSQAASKAKKRYHAFKAIEITLAAAVPFLSALTTAGSLSYMKVLVGCVGVGVTIASGMLLLYKFHEIWANYRGTAESLRSEKYLFLSRSGPYRTRGANQFFIERIEGILGQQNQKWQSYISQNQEGEDGNPSESKGLGIETQTGAEAAGNGENPTNG